MYWLMDFRFNIIATLCYLHQNHLPNYECSEPLKAKILGIQELAPVCFEVSWNKSNL